MKNLYKPVLPMNLQFFASPDDGGGAGGNEPTGNDSGTGMETTISFDDYLKLEGNQAEFDRRMQKAIQKAVSKNDDKWKALNDQNLSEAEKLAKMNEAEKLKYMQDKRERELSDREAAITRKELMAEAKNTLAEKNLPVSLAEALNYTDAESCSASIDMMEKAFQTAVQSAVEERLKGGEPPHKPEDGNGVITKEDYRKLGYMERMKLKTENPELYKQLSGI